MNDPLRQEMANHPLPEKWMKAAVMGSLWAVMEIVFGSFLHNMKIPFAGSILSFFAVFLVVAFSRVWQTNGLIWRAGLICALMKSLSPGAIILGPMVGIFSEALILELAFRFLGRNRAASILGGALAVFSALVQKALTLLVLYGWDFVKLLDGIVLFASRQLGMDKLQPEYLLLILSGVYLLSGGVAAWLGFVSGQNYLKNKQDNLLVLPRLQPSPNPLSGHSTKKMPSFLILPVLLLLLISGMVLIQKASLPVSTLYVFGFMFFGIFRYKLSLRFLKRGSFWLQIIVLLVFSALFFPDFSPRDFFVSEGWGIGWKMILRAQILLTAFSAMGRELKNPVVRNILFRRGLRNLYLSLDMAFSALPGLIEVYTGKGYRFSGISRLMKTLLGSSQALLNEYLRFGQARPGLVLVTGGVNSGKSTWVKELVAHLKDSGWRIGGLLSPGEPDRDGRKTYFAEDLSTGEREFLCDEHAASGTLRSGRYFFSEKGLLFGENVLKKAAEATVDLIVIDEVGPLEIRGEGWAAAMEKMNDKGGISQLWVVREKWMETVLRKWNIGEHCVIRAGDQNPEEAAQGIGHFWKR